MWLQFSNFVHEHRLLQIRKLIHQCVIRSYVRNEHPVRFKLTYHSVLPPTPLIIISRSPARQGSVIMLHQHYSHTNHQLGWLFCDQSNIAKITIRNSVLNEMVIVTYLFHLFIHVFVVKASSADTYIRHVNKLINHVCTKRCIHNDKPEIR